MAKQRDRVLWEMRVVVTLVAVSMILYVVHFFWFRDMQHIWLWSFTSLSFLPISALVVTLLINRFLSARDKALRLDKLNMLIGLFFSNVGNELLLRFSDWDAEDQYLRNHFGAPEPWGRLIAKNALAMLKKHGPSLSVDRPELGKLKAFLDPRLDFLMRMMENPSLLEHENFTRLMRAVFHLAEELSYRHDFESIPEADLRHLTGDIERAYGLILREWVLYMIFLKRNFPFLFSLAVRTNPLDRSAVVTISEKLRPPNKPDSGDVR